MQHGGQARKPLHIEWGGMLPAGAASGGLQLRNIMAPPLRTLGHAVMSARVQRGGCRLGHPSDSATRPLSVVLSTLRALQILVHRFTVRHRSVPADGGTPRRAPPGPCR